MPANKKAASASRSTKAQEGSEAVTPLAYMLSVMRDPEADSKRRDDMAKTAAPYVHPRLSSVDHGGEVTVTHEQALDELS
jgi:hypothetical protein